jgi:hypothetical protein
MTDDWSLKGKEVHSTRLVNVSRPKDVITTPESGWKNLPAYLSSDIEILRQKLIENILERVIVQNIEEWEPSALKQYTINIINALFGVE